MWSYAIVAGVLLIGLIKPPAKENPVQTTPKKTVTTDDVLDYHFRTIDDLENQITYWENIHYVDDEIVLNEVRKLLQATKIKFFKSEISRHQKEINKILKD